MSDRTRSTVRVKVEIIDPDDRLFLELAGTVSFPGERDGQQSRCRQDVPRTQLKSAVFQESGHDYAWVVQKDNIVRKSQVQVATTTEDLARVESGLKLDDAVVLNPLKSLREYDKVRIAE